MKRILMSCLGALAFALPAVADSIQLTGVGVNNQGGVYTVPYFLSINGATPISTMCDDYLHDVVIGETWQGSEFTYASLSTNLAFTRAGASTANGGLGLDLATAQQDYRELFWLLSQYSLNPASGNNINFAAWAIFDPAVTGQAGWTTGPNSAASWLALAQMSTNYNSVDTTRFLIISPNDLKDGTGTVPVQLGSPQEYITQVPEPSSLVFLATGLAGAYWRRRSA